MIWIKDDGRESIPKVQIESLKEGRGRRRRRGRKREGKRKKEKEREREGKICHEK